MLRRFSTRSEIAASIGSIAISFALMGLFQFVFGSAKTVAEPLVAGAPVDFLGAVVPRQNLVVIGLAIILTAILAVIMGMSRLGLAIRATAGNLSAARGAGIPVVRTQAVVFGLGGALAFVAGAALAPITGAGFNAGQALMVSVFTATVLGGLGSLWMAGVGGVLLGLLQAILGATPAGPFTRTTLFVLLMVILLVRPGGIAGKRLGAVA
jgi:branched-chain amino acid transport system permease protein